MVEWDELRVLIKDRMDSQEIVDLLELKVDNLLDAFKDEILDKLPEFLEVLGMEDEEIDE